MKETVEEAALRIIPDKSTAGWVDGFSATERIGFVKGAQWQSEQDNWISVEERLPEGRMSTVLAYHKSSNDHWSHHFIANYYEQTGWQSDLELIPTHWQPLPPPPKVKETQK